MTQAWELFRFELGYQLRRASTRLYFLIFVGFAVMNARIFFMNAREDGYVFNAPIIVSAVTIVSSMFALLVTAGVAGDAATRDVHVRMHSLLYTTPLRKAAYVGGRFAGAFAITALLVFAVPIGLLAATWMPGIERELLGPFRPEAYLTSFILFAVPNAFVSTAVLFAVAALTRRAATAYAGGAALFFVAFIAEGFLAARLGQWGAGKLLDPLGYTTLREFWRSLNPLQKSTTVIGFHPELLSNRLLWVAIAASVLAIAAVRLRFAYDAGAGSRRRDTVVDDIPFSRWSGVAVPRAGRAFGAGTRLRQLAAMTARSCAALLAGRAWLIVPVVAVIFMATAPELLEVELGTPGAATSARLADLFGPPELRLLIALLIVLSAAELVWRERDARIDAIADTAPVPEWIAFGGKLLALGLMLAAAHAVFLTAGIAVQLMMGFPRVDLAVYLQILFGFQLTAHLLFAALAMAIHVVVNQKYVGTVLGMLAFIGINIANELGVDHHLLLYGRAPEPSHSEIAGFGGQVAPWAWFTGYWAGWALLFVVMTYLFWIRGEERRLRTRLTLARRRLTRWPAAVLVVALAIIAAAGGFTFYNTNVLNRYETAAEAGLRQADYEKRYGRYASLPQPILAATKLHVEFHPERHAADIRGSYRLENRSAAAIDSIHLVTNRSVETRGISFDRPADLTLEDEQHGYRIYTLATPLRPGEAMRMDFEVLFRSRGFRNGGRNPSVIANGSWIQHRADQRHSDRQWLPFVGYQRNRELSHAVTRAKYGLPERPAVRALDDAAGRSEQRGREQIEFEAIVGTELDQTAVAPGVLRRSWTESGRRYFHYVADAPIRNGYAIFSARYAVHRAQWRDVSIELFHHPAHSANLDRMVRSVQASLEYNSRHFGRYPYRQLKLVEYPSSPRGLRLTAHPGTIMFSEGFALVRPDDDPRRIDLPFAVIAHEIGHQWWGHQVIAAPVEGAGVVSESLAWYSGLATVENALGRDHLQRLVGIMRREYLAPHERRQVPLLRAVEAIDAYRTGPFAMYALREIVGEERVNAALRNLVLEFDPSRPPYATSMDLYDELRAVTPEPMHYLLKDLFEEITFWDLRAEEGRVQATGDGSYRVTLRIESQKLKGDAAGKETVAAMNDLIDIAVFDSEGEALYRAPQRIRSGEQDLTIDVKASRRPARAAIDPDHVLLDRQPEDNAVELAGEAVR